MTGNRNPHARRPTGIGECEMEPVLSTVDVKDSITTWITDQSIDFLETRDTTRPFFLWTSFTKPHPPFDPCRDFWSLYENIPMPAPVYGDWSRDLEKAPQGFLAGAYENTNMHLFGPEQVAASRRAYYACITQLIMNWPACSRAPGKRSVPEYLDHFHLGSWGNAGRSPHVPEKPVL